MASANLVVDASSVGDGTWVVRGHLLNSKTRRGYQGSDLIALKGPFRSLNQLFGSPLQVDGLNPTQLWPSAPKGDASSTACMTTSQRGTPLLVNMRVTNIEETPGRKGRYLVSMKDAAGKDLKIYTNQVAIATGLGVPKVPLRDAASKAYIQAQAKRIREGGATARRTAVMTVRTCCAPKSASNLRS